MLDAEQIINSKEVTQLDVGARCYRSLQIEELLIRLSRYSNVEKLRVADDYVSDADMESVKNSFVDVFGNVSFEWAHDLLIDGKHGR